MGESVFLIYGTRGVPCDHSHPRVLLLEVASRPTDCPAGPGGTGKMGDPALGLFPDLRTSRTVVNVGVHWIEMLIGKNGVWVRSRDRPTLHYVVLGMIGGHRRWSYDY